MGYLLIGVAFLAASVASLALAPTPLTRLVMLLALLVPAGLVLVRWLRLRRRELNRRSIMTRLTRLPDDFTLLHNLTVRAPWGDCHIEYVILSRFGLVVAGAGPNPGWMAGQVEALRTLCFRQGVRLPANVVRALTIIPPGCTALCQSNPEQAAVPVGRLTLQHVAPSAQAVLTPDQIQIITRCLTQPWRGAR